MMTIKIFCDICLRGNEVKVCKDTNIQVVSLTDREGEATKPYLTTVDIDICESCLDRRTSGESIYKKGNWANSEYFFKPLIQQL